MKLFFLENIYTKLSHKNIAVNICGLFNIASQIILPFESRKNVDIETLWLSFWNFLTSFVHNPCKTLYHLEFLLSKKSNLYASLPTTQRIPLLSNGANIPTFLFVVVEKNLLKRTFIALLLKDWFSVQFKILDSINLTRNLNFIFD